MLESVYAAAMAEELTVVLEINATEVLFRFSFRQMLSYLTVTRLPIGLILHFRPRARFFRMVSSRRRPS